MALRTVRKLFSLLLFAVQPCLAGQEAADRILALPGTRPVLPQTLLFTVEHRSASPAFDHPFRDGLGLDNGGLKINLGLRYGVFSNLDVGLRRGSNAGDFFDTYEMDARYLLIDDSVKVFAATAMAGVTWFYQENLQDASGFYGALLLSKNLGRRINLETGLLGHSNSTYSTKTDADPVYSMAVPAGLTVNFGNHAGINAECFMPVAGYSAGKPGYAAGVKFTTWRHTFSVLLTNTRYATFDGMVSGANRLNSPSLGFLITRLFGN